MRLKAAVLATLTKGKLRRVTERLQLTDVDPTDQNDMSARLMRDPRATAQLLLEYLPADDVPDVVQLVGLPRGSTEDDLRRLARAQDAEDARTSPGPAPPESQRPQHPPDMTADAAASSARDIVAGALVMWGPHELLGVVVAVENRRITVRFDNGETRVFAADAGVLKRVRFQPTDQVMRLDGTLGVILEEVPGQARPTWRVFFGGAIANVDESALRPATIMDPVGRMRAGRLGTAEEFNLRSVAADYWTAHQHNELVSLAHARVDLKPHQVSVAHRVVSNYPHRFMLCDEVGLGKTIEAAMIIKELRARGQARRVLILVPSGLLRQWQFELKTKFNETFSVYTKNTVRHLRDQGKVNPWAEGNSVIVSHSWASWSDERRRAITAVDWDMIVVDEAHHARIHRSGNSTTRTNLYRLANELVADKTFSRRAALFLTATPLQLERYELYALVDMLNPVLFVSEKDFEQHFDSLSGLNRMVERLEAVGIPTDGERSGLLRDLARFLEIGEAEADRLLRTESPTTVAARLRARHRLSEVMIRNRKADVVGFQPRRAFRWEVELSPTEQQVQRMMERVLEEGWRLQRETQQNAIGFLMVILQKLSASSSRALLASLLKRRERLAGVSRSTGVEEADEDLAEDAEAASVVEALAPGVELEIRQFDQIIALLQEIDTDTKARVLVEQLGRLFEEEPDAKVLIFTEFRETQDMLVELLSDRWAVHKFHGQMALEQKDSAVNAFRVGRGTQVLISTEAGGEGRNFQFCHHLVNYDLPWNPMRVEQRIGRLDRIGQEHPITIFNFHVHGTIESRILEVLERRIRIFEEAVGGLDPILGEAEADIRKALRLAREARDEALERLGRNLELQVERARQAERELQDLIMKSKSFSAQIAQRLAGQQAPILQEEFELFLTRLLAWAHTFLRRETNGEWRVAFHAPFTMEHPELFADREALRVCFDPRQHVDSEFVEYLGFGHPIVDALIRRIWEEKPDGAAAVRVVDGREVSLDRPGWQFNWIIKVGGLKPKAFLYPLFVGDSGRVDEEAGRRLLLLSRRFRREDGAATQPWDGLDTALAAAQEHAGRRAETERQAAVSDARERADIEERRVHALFEQRRKAAQDRIASCRGVLRRLRESTDRLQLQAVPLWEANLERAEAELDAITHDREKALRDIDTRRHPEKEFSLLNVARILPA